MVIKPLAESALLIEVGDTIAAATTEQVLALTAALDAAAVPGVTDIVPAYTTILIGFDPAVVHPDDLARTVRELANAAPGAAEPGAMVTIPVHYGGALGPDLADVAAHTGLSAEEVILRHAAAEYRVACMGFAPGFGFLLGLPPELTTPRRNTPRTHVPAGSVAIGGAQTGTYSLATPGGWHLIGRTPLRLFDPDRADPFTLHAGDRVRFEAVDVALPDEAVAVPRQRSQPMIVGEPADTTDTRGGIIVRDAGLLTTVQDLGRPGLARFGVSPGGALDRGALILGNRLVGNDPGEAGLEMTLVGPRLAFTTRAIVALTGADLGGRLNGAEAPRWQPFAVAPGDDLTFDPRLGTGHGARAYLCVAGGFDLPSVMGSRATDLFGGFGGLNGRALRVDDSLAWRNQTAPNERRLRRRLAVAPPVYHETVETRVVLGPQDDRFTSEGLATLLGTPFTVSPRADRMALRLSGAAVTHSHGADVISEGIPLGAIQVPGDGQPIVILPGRQTIGGYTKIATAIGADIDALGQARPGQTIAFRAVDPATARDLTLAAAAALGGDAVTDEPRSVPGWSPPSPSSEAQATMTHAASPVEWDADAVIRLVGALRETGVTAFRLEIAAIGLTLDLQRMVLGGGDPTHPATTATDSADTPEVVTAPLLGVFYRRAAPDQPLLAEEGQRVEAGQTLGLLEVMKTYHEVTAPRAGVVTAFLVEDGQFVEYGEGIVRLTAL